MHKLSYKKEEVDWLYLIKRSWFYKKTAVLNKISKRIWKKIKVLVNLDECIISRFYYKKLLMAQEREVEFSEKY